MLHHHNNVRRRYERALAKPTARPASRPRPMRAWRPARALLPASAERALPTWLWVLGASLRFVARTALDALAIVLDFVRMAPIKLWVVFGIGLVIWKYLPRR